MVYNIPAVVVSTLEKLGHATPTKCLGSLPVASVAQLPVRSQIELTNRRLRIAFGALNANTETIRSKIHDNVDYEEWVTIFKRDLAPEIVRLDI